MVLHFITNWIEGWSFCELYQSYLVYLWPARFHPIHHFPGTILEMMHFKAVIFRVEEPSTFSNEVDKYNTINFTNNSCTVSSSLLFLGLCVCVRVSVRACVCVWLGLSGLQWETSQKAPWISLTCETSFIGIIRMSPQLPVRTVHAE